MATITLEKLNAPFTEQLNDVTSHLQTEQPPLPAVQQPHLNPQDWATIAFYAERYQVKAVYLFGSSLETPDQANDIDLAVSGIPPHAFFAFYGKLLRHLSKPVDVVDLSYPSRLTELIQAKAVLIYGQA